MLAQLKKLLDYAIARGREPSTWAGVSVMLVALRVHVSAEWAQAIGFAGPALAAAVAIVLGDS